MTTVTSAYYYTPTTTTSTPTATTTTATATSPTFPNKSSATVQPVTQTRYMTVCERRAAEARGEAMPADPNNIYDFGDTVDALTAQAAYEQDPQRQLEALQALERYLPDSRAEVAIRAAQNSSDPAIREWANQFGDDTIVQNDGGFRKYWWLIVAAILAGGWAVYDLSKED